MKIAIIGTGISGLTAAHLLSQKHEVVVYEAADRIGGHTATKTIEYAGETYTIDTGFIVFNDWTYPNFEKLLEQLGVDSQTTDMGFSVSCANSGVEYSGDSLNTLFAQRRNLLSRQHWKMIKDILRFNKEAPRDLENGTARDDITLGEYLKERHYSAVFIERYLIPMGAAIWSASTSVIQQFPLRFFIAFFKNHGLLSVNNRPQWRVIKGGSSAYLPPLIQSFNDNIRLNSPVVSVQRTRNDNVVVTTQAGNVEEYDQVVIACHSDQALAMLQDVDHNEQAILGAIAYKDNEVVLHTDDTLLPKNKKTWSSWNYKITDALINDEPPVLTYNMNILQGLDAPCTFCVTLNKTEEIDPKKILGVYHYSHPVFSVEVVAAQQRWQEINGQKNTWFCGAYWANGFHEDGVKSAVRVAKALGVEW
jgi:predicted NAD/FAD-binding protein